MADLTNLRLREKLRGVKAGMAGHRNKIETDRDKDIIRKAWPDLSLSARLRYIISYYGVYIAAAVVFVMLCLFFARDIAQKRPQDDFYVAVLESQAEEADVEELTARLKEYLGFGGAESECLIETDYSGEQNIQSAATVSAYMQSGRIDLLIAPEERFNRYAAASYLAPLDEPEQEWSGMIQAWEPDELLYASAYDYGKGGAVEEIPFRPHEITEDAKCYGIYLQDGIFEGYVIGVMVNCPHREYIEKALQFFVPEIDFEQK